MSSLVYKWVRISLLNLLIVSLLGIILRYKIVFSLPFVDQKKLLHGHSHFAFAGWISNLLMSLMILYLAEQSKGIEKKYAWLINANLITAYGMLISFPVEGYGPVSIVFSTLSIFVSYAFAYIYWRDLNRLPVQSGSHLWFKAALVFNVISSAGAFSLAGMMAFKNSNQELYLAAVYGFLHFQYNGWFLFVCFGLLYNFLQKRYEFKIPRLVFFLFAISCIPAYLLSVLWAKLPAWLYAVAVIASVAQLYGWLHFLLRIKKIKAFPGKGSLSRLLLLLVAFAFTVKLLLQMTSTIPAVGKLAFGFRPIVIGYLHLVLLGIITIFLIACLQLEGFLSAKRSTVAGVVIFVAGVILNEVVLMMQGVADIFYNPVMSAPELLFVIALIMACGLLVLNISMKSFRKMTARIKDREIRGEI